MLQVAFGAGHPHQTGEWVFLWRLNGEIAPLEVPWDGAEIADESPVTSIAFSPDSTTMAWAAENKILSWTPDSNEPVRTIGRHTERVNQITFIPSVDAPPVHALASCSGMPPLYDNQDTIVEPGKPGTMKVWDLERGKSFSLPVPHNGPRVPIDVTVSPNGKNVASVSLRGTVDIWRLSTIVQTEHISTIDEPQHSLTRHLGIRSSSLEFKGNKEIVLGSSDNVIRIIGLQNNEILNTFLGHSGEVTGWAGSANANFFVSGSHDHTVKTWNLDESPRYLPDLEVLANYPESQKEMTILPNGSSIATTRGILDRNSGEDLWRPKQPQRYGGRLSISSGDRPLLATESAVYDLTSREPIHRYPGRNQGGKGASVRGVALSPNGCYVAASDASKGWNLIKIWDLEGELLHEFKVSRQEKGFGDIWDIEFFPEKQWLACALGSYTKREGSPTSGRGEPGEVQIWDWKEGRRLHVLNTDRYCPWGIAITPDGSRIASAGGRPHPSNEAPKGGEALVWDAESKNLEQIFSKDLRYCSFDVAFSPDGRRLIAASGKHRADTPVQLPLWDVETGSELIRLRGAESTVYKAIFSPDGHKVLAATEKGKILKFDGSPHNPKEVVLDE